MPELPDVEVTRRMLEERVVGRRIAAIEAERNRVLGKLSTDELRERVAGKKVTGASRRGKHLLIALAGDGVLGMHFGLTGSLELGEGPAPRNCRLLLTLDRGERLAYVDPRQFGRIALGDSIEAYIAERDLGPDALGLAAKAFATRLSGRRGPLKPTLMDQSLVAGIGNVYADEVLFRARLHPLTATSSLDGRALGRLDAVIQQVLAQAIARGADPEQLPDSWLIRHRGKGGTCPRCGGKLTVRKVGGRTSYWCERCQRRGT